MDNQIDFVAIMEGKSEINKIFHSVRIMDLKDNAVCEFVDGVIVKNNTDCYCDKNRKRPCKNCIVRNSMVKQKQLVKLQYHNDSVEFVLAMPMTFMGHNYVLELVKDITDSMVIHDKYHPDNTNIYDIVNQLNTVSSMDPFTNLYNKKYISKQIKEDIKEIKVSKEPYIIALIDIDNFKWVNDTFGHLHGDAVIQDLVHLIHKYTDDHNCWAARYGGDEFLLVFQGEDMTRVMEYCKQIELGMSQKVYHNNQEEYQVTISVGLYQFDPEEDDYYSLLENVDVNMYKNKERNKKSK